MDKPLIMVLEDEVKQADMIARLIEATGKYDVLKAYNGKEGLALLKENRRMLRPNRISLILLDIKMPEMDGLQFLDALRRTYSEEEIGAIMLTAYEDEEKWEKATSGFVVGYLKKPVVEEELLEKIRTFYSHPGARVQMTLETFERHIEKIKEFGAEGERTIPEREILK